MDAWKSVCERACRRALIRYTSGLMTVEAALRFIAAIYGPIPKSSAADAYADAARSRLGLELPASLLEYYAATAASDALHRSHNRLVKPEAIDTAAEHLVIYEENQGVVVWGIPLERIGDDNPPVEQGQREDDAWVFYPEFDSLGQFAAAQAAWQAVQGAVRYCGVREGYIGVVSEVLGDPELVTDSMMAWLVDGGVCIDAGGGYLGLATRDAAAFERTSQRLNMAIADWDWAELQED